MRRFLVLVALFCTSLPSIAQQESVRRLLGSQSFSETVAQLRSGGPASLFPVEQVATFVLTTPGSLSRTEQESILLILLQQASASEQALLFQAIAPYIDRIDDWTLLTRLLSAGDDSVRGDAALAVLDRYQGVLAGTGEPPTGQRAVIRAIEALAASPSKSLLEPLRFIAERSRSRSVVEAARGLARHIATHFE